MGDIADMMLEGDLCAGCGSYMGGESDGIPRYCSSDCEPNDYKQAKKNINKTEKIPCPMCKKKCNGKQGVEANIKKLHGNEIVIIVKKDSDEVVEDWWFARAVVRGKEVESSAQDIGDAISGVADLVAERIYEKT